MSRLELSLDAQQDLVEIKTQVSENHFPQSDPVSAQAVALGGNPLKRETVVADVEGDVSGDEPDEKETAEYATGRPEAG